MFKSRERVVLSYDHETETVPTVTRPTDGVIISDDHLKTLDKELAPYPFDGLEKWKSLTRHISQDVLEDVLGESGRVDRMTQADGEDDEVDGRSVDGESRMKFPSFRLKRSWREGAVGEEVTRYARDKSWLMGNVLTDSLTSGMSF